MLLLLVLLGLAAEVAAFIVVAQHIGVVLAFVLLFGVSLLSPFLIRRAGAGVLESARLRLARGEAPTREVLDGVVVLLGGLLVAVPGFIGDAIGLLLLIPPVRRMVIRFAGRRLASGLVSTSTPGAGSRVVDVTSRLRGRGGGASAAARGSGDGADGVARGEVERPGAAPRSAPGGQVPPSDKQPPAA